MFDFDKVRQRKGCLINVYDSKVIKSVRRCKYVRVNKRPEVETAASNIIHKFYYYNTHDV